MSYIKFFWCEKWWWSMFLQKTFKSHFSQSINVLWLISPQEEESLLSLSCYYCECSFDTFCKLSFQPHHWSVTRIPSHLFYSTLCQYKLQTCTFSRLTDLCVVIEDNFVHYCIANISGQHTQLHVTSTSLTKVSESVIVTFKTLQ